MQNQPATKYRLVFCQAFLVAIAGMRHAKTAWREDCQVLLHAKIFKKCLFSSYPIYPFLYASQVLGAADESTLLGFLLQVCFVLGAAPQPRALDCRVSQNTGNWNRRKRKREEEQRGHSPFLIEPIQPPWTTAGLPHLSRRVGKFHTMLSTTFIVMSIENCITSIKHQLCLLCTMIIGFNLIWNCYNNGLSSKNIPSTLYFLGIPRSWHFVDILCVSYIQSLTLFGTTW